jgi:tRNA nucleotidyltransferase/poly(A) polymerase
MMNCNINLLLLQIFQILESASKENYLVGGCVRDQFLGLEPHDYDIVTDVPIEVSTKLFEDAGWKIKECGEAFLVLNVSKFGQQFEIANFRKDGVYLDGRRPEAVEIGTIAEDANRRDFTVNALYMDPFTGEVKDPTGLGLEDIESRTLRFIGKASERIEEDNLRVFRFYRFLAKGFKPERNSLKACRRVFNDVYLNTTPERVRLELEKMVGLL